MINIRKRTGRRFIVLAVLGVIMILAARVGIKANAKGGESGFDTSKKAAEAYVNGLCSKDMEAVMEACAVDSYIQNYHLECRLNRVKAHSAVINNDTVMPNVSDFASELNRGARKGKINEMVFRQYLALHDAEIVSEDQSGMDLFLSDYSSAEDMILDMYFDKERELSFKGEFIPDYAISMDLHVTQDWKGDESYLLTLTGADAAADEAVIVYADEKPYLLVLNTLCYNGRWYVSTYNRLGDYLLGVSNSSGVHALDKENIRFSTQNIRNYLADPNLKNGLDKAMANYDKITADEWAQIEAMDVEESDARIRDIFMKGLTEDEEKALGSLE